MSLIHAEYLKISRRKLFPFMTAILVVLTLFTGFVLLYLAEIFPEVEGQFPSFNRSEALVVGAQQIAGQTWFPLILAVVLLGAEFSTTVWATSLTRDARKGLQVGSRIVVITIASWLAMLIVMGAWTVMALGVEGGNSLGIADWVGIFWRLGLVQLPWVALGMGLVSVMRSVGPAIGAVIALQFIEQILALWSAYQNVSLTAANSALFDVDWGDSLGVFIPGGNLTTLHSIVIIGGWSAIGSLLIWVGVQVRDA